MAEEKMKMYYMALVLPPALNEIIQRYKEMMKERYGARVALKSPAHITIIPPFWLHPNLEPQLLNDLATFSSGIQSFTIETKNFSAFKPRTIFIDIEKSEALKQLKHSADAFFSRPQYRIKPEERTFRPHVTIATRDLSKHAFAEAWPWFAEKKFEKTFPAEGLSLLRHNGSYWDVIVTTAFQPG